ncbi:myosin light chain mlc1 [Cystoisospora suis]|uniref:Myosin light chain mlc1 n=1 Tax=Cystoisospora suis TaxID=483139 RepID=A0A2C6KG10_9APIC|nr:myosin light chain mlc1 [Cystoisospora suis]
MQRAANRGPNQVAGAREHRTAPGFAKWKVGKKAAPPGGKAAAKKPQTSPGAEGQEGGEVQVPRYGGGTALTVSVLRTLEPQRNPLIAGGDDEHNLVLLQRLQLDAFQDRDHAFEHSTREYALSRSVGQRRLARREIDLSYLPDEASGSLDRAGERVSDGGEVTLCEKIARDCLGIAGYARNGYDIHSDPTLLALKTEVGHLRRWGEALHDYNVIPATAPVGDEAPSPPRQMVRGHVASCDDCLPEGLTPEERKRELIRRRKDPTRDRTFLDGPPTCPAGPRRVEQGYATSIRPPAFPLATEAQQLFRRGSDADVEAELQGAGGHLGGALQNDLDMILDDYDDDDASELDELNQKGAGGTGRVKELVEFFGRKVPVSQRVKMLEIDSRALLATIKQLRSANEESKKKLEEALREKEAMAQDVEMREKIVAQREKAVKLTLRDHLRVQRSLQRGMAEASSLLQEEKKTVSAVRTSAGFLQRKLETAQTVTETHEQELNALRDQIEEMKKEYDRKEAEDFTDQKAWRKDQIKLEKLHFRCECLGEDRIRLLEAVRREKANLDLREAELVLYKKHLEDMTKERDHFFDTAEAVKKKSAEEKAALQKRAREALEKKNAALAEQEQATKEQQQRNAELTVELDKERVANTSSVRHMKAMKEIIKSQQELLKSQSANFGSFMKSLYELQEKLAVLTKLANNLRAAYARHQERLRVQIERDHLRRRVSAEVPPPRETEDSAPTPKTSAKPAKEVPKDAINQAFSAVANGADELSADAAATAARKAGLAPSNADIEALRAATKNVVDRKAFEKFCNTVVHNEDEGSKLASVFKVWDTSNSGVLPKAQVKFLLQTFGDPLTAEEADFAIRVLADDADPINYRLFCEKLLACGAARS